MGPIWDRSGQPAHEEPGCTPHMGSPYGTHIGMFAGKAREQRAPTTLPNAVSINQRLLSVIYKCFNLL